jgi:hypothetical protein
MKQSQIRYTLSCTSTSLQLKAGSNNYMQREAKPSDVIKELLSNKSTGL